MWADDEALLAAAIHLEVGHVLPVPLVPVDQGLRQQIEQFTQLGPVRAQLDLGHPTTSSSRSSSRMLQVVTEIAAVTCPHRLDPDGYWRPDRRRTRTTSVSTTGGVTVGRNIWPPSGAPLLLGFLLRCSPHPADDYGQEHIPLPPADAATRAAAGLGRSKS